MSLDTFEKLVTLFTEHHADFKILEHASARTSEEAAEFRGTVLGQGAKAMICRVKISSHHHIYVHTVIPADQQVDFQKVALAAEGKKASLATPEEAQALTDCVMGSVPPVSFNPEAILIVDLTLASRFEEIAFNGGLRERSIVIKTQDYLRIVKPKMASIIKGNAA